MVRERRPHEVTPIVCNGNIVTQEQFDRLIEAARETSRWILRAGGMLRRTPAYGIDKLKAAAEAVLDAEIEEYT